MPPTKVVCIKVGTKYGPEYVNRLAASVARHTTVPHEFVCWTDDSTGLACARAPIGTDLPGWWAKLVLFTPHTERLLFLDLDTVIVDNMDFLFEYDGPFAILSDFYHPAHYGSAVMSIAPGFGASIWADYTEAQHGRWWGDQVWIETCAPGADRWQDLYPGKIVSYKVQCQDGVPAGASIVCFHGEPRPHQVTHLPFMQEHWHDRSPVTR